MRLVAVMALAACSASTTSDDTRTFAADPIAVAAGSELVECWDFTIADALAITAADVALPPATHHWSLTIESGTARSGGYDCTNMPAGGPMAATLGIGGPGAAALAFPDGAAFTIAAGDVMTLQVHLLNATDAAITAAPQIDLTVAANASGLAPVGLLVAASNSIDLQPGALGVQVEAKCSAPQALAHVFDGYLHAHTRGRELTFDAGGQRLLDANPWNFEMQKIYPLELAIDQGTPLALTCTYDNPGTTEIRAGQLASDEMCVGVLYYYPANTPIVSCFGM